MSISIVVDTGFGDAGKGVVVDYLCSQALQKSSPDKILVIRFSGGHQAGHTVCHAGFKHTFSSFASGTLRGIDSYYSRHTVVFAPAALLEAAVLRRFAPVLIVHPLAMMTTPYDIAWNQIVEAPKNHGSCGAGFGATVERVENGVGIFVQDLQNDWVFRQKLASVEQYYKNRIEGHLDLPFSKQVELGSDTNSLSKDSKSGKGLIRPAKAIKAEFRQEMELLDIDRFIQDSRNYFSMIRVASLEQIQDQYSDFIFEGSQGVLLDPAHGIFPHVTRSHTTSRNAWECISGLDKQVAIPQIYYVSRCYQTRHGAGPMSSTEAVALMNTNHEINQEHEFQGVFRTAKLDPELLNYAFSCDRNYHPNRKMESHLVLTCLDQLPGFDVQGLLNQLTVKFTSVLVNDSHKSGFIKQWPVN